MDTAPGDGRRGRVKAEAGGTEQEVGCVSRCSLGTGAFLGSRLLSVCRIHAANYLFFAKHGAGALRPHSRV